MIASMFKTGLARSPPCRATVAATGMRSQDQLDWCARSWPNMAPQPRRRCRPTARSPATIAQWRALQQTDALPFDSYAGFLLAHPGWPGETADAPRGRDGAGRATGRRRRAVALLPPLPAADRRRAASRFARGAGGDRRARRGECARRATAGVAGALSPADEATVLPSFPGALTAGRSRRADGRAAVAGRRPTAAQRQIAADQPGAGARCSRRGSRSAPTRPTPPSAALRRRRSARAIPAMSPTARSGCAISGAAPAARALLARPRVARDAAGRCRALVSRCCSTNARGAAADGQYAARLRHRAPGRRRLSAPAPTSATKPYGERDDYTEPGLARRADAR